MTEDLWSHALKFLDKYRWDDEDGDVDDNDELIMLILSVSSQNELQYNKTK